MICDLLTHVAECGASIVRFEPSVKDKTICNGEQFVTHILLNLREADRFSRYDLEEFVYSRHPGNRREWNVRPGAHLMTRFPRLLGAPRLNNGRFDFRELWT